MKTQTQNVADLFSKVWFLPSVILVLSTLVMTPMVVVLKFEDGFGWFHFAILISNITTALTSSMCAFVGMIVYKNTKSWIWTSLGVLLGLTVCIFLSRYFIFQYFQPVV